MKPNESSLTFKFLNLRGPTLNVRAIPDINYTLLRD